jgi:hypothetical protein
MTKAQQLGITIFPYKEYDDRHRNIYWESDTGFWIKFEYDNDSNKIYLENSDGFGWIRKFNHNNVLLSEIDIQTWRQIQHRNSVISNLL